MRRLVGLAECAFCFFAINLFMGAYVVLPLRISGEDIATSERNPWYAAAQALVLSGTLVLCIAKSRRVLAAGVKAGLVNCFVLMAALSVAWSVDPSASLRRVIMLATATALAYYLVATRPVERIISTFALACVIAAIASAAVALITPEFGLMGESEAELPEVAGAWTGIFVHKNELGSAMVLGAQACTWLAATRSGRRRLLPILGALICFAVVLQARSKTAELVVIATPIFFFALRVLHLPGLALLWAVFAVVTLCLLGASVAALFFNEIMEAIGKDPSLTGRVPLWQELVSLVRARPLEGYGYMGFFTPGNPDLDSVHRAIGWKASTAHQGYLDMLLQLGVLGLALALAALARATWLSLAAVRAGTPWASFAAVVMLALVVTSAVEAVLMRATSIHAVLLPLVYAATRAQSARSQTVPFHAGERTIGGANPIGASMTAARRR